MRRFEASSVIAADPAAIWTVPTDRAERSEGHERMPKAGTA
jgi:hypothetical protein